MFGHRDDCSHSMSFVDGSFRPMIPGVRWILDIRMSVYGCLNHGRTKITPQAYFCNDLGRIDLGEGCVA